jgi:hypothetical protein
MRNDIAHCCFLFVQQMWISPFKEAMQLYEALIKILGLFSGEELRGQV